jgi:hypothetical protein
MNYMMNLLLLNILGLFLNCHSGHAPAKNAGTAFTVNGIDTAALVKKIRADFTAVNAKQASYKKKTVNAPGFSAEGGEVTSYHRKSDLVKIHAVFYGETGKVETDYYFNPDGLFFQYNKETFYDKPIYVKGFKVKKTAENRYYFYKKTLIRWLDGPKVKVVTPKGFKEKERAIHDDVKDMQDVLHGDYKN